MYKPGDRLAADTINDLLLTQDKINNLRVGPGLAVRKNSTGIYIGRQDDDLITTALISTSSAGGNPFYPGFYYAEILANEVQGKIQAGGISPLSGSQHCIVWNTMETANYYTVYNSSINSPFCCPPLLSELYEYNSGVVSGVIDGVYDSQ